MQTKASSGVLCGPLPWRGIEGALEPDRLEPELSTQASASLRACRGPPSQQGDWSWSWVWARGTCWSSLGRPSRVPGAFQSAASELGLRAS